ncbi:MAG: zinc-binding dehydrogenase [Phycisphaeraceae bacterium]|nr:zinc-binding dehydrogenase [Phycisphaeraceae bacterium]
MLSRQVVIPSERQVVLQDVELPVGAPGPNQALLRTRASFISAGTELAVYAAIDPRVWSKDPYFAYPARPGYANIATVEAVGEKVKQVQPGQRVFTFHPHVQDHVFDLWDWDVIEPVPEGVDDATAGAARMGLVSISSLQVADVALNDWVAVFGLGIVGNLACQFFQLAGARVIGVDPVAARCDLARRTGIEHVIAGSGKEAQETIRELTGGGVRVAVDAVGHAAIVREAMEIVVAHGQVVLLGSPRVTHETDVTAMLKPIFGRWVTVTGALEWRLPRLPGLDPHARHTTLGNLRMIFDLMARGRLKVAPLVTHRMPVEKIKEAYDGLLMDKEHFHGVALLWA